MLSAAFVNFWRTDLTRTCFLSFVPQEDLKALRLVCHDFAQDAAPQLFAELTLRFNVNTFSRHARMIALERIGHYVRTLSFQFHHTADTFLPPLLVPETLEDVNFLYEPHIDRSRPTSSSSASSGSRYGDDEMNDLLVKHYPPLFHAATNITAFTQAISALPNVRRLNVGCSSQGSNHRYRKNVVDYALASLRIAVEQANPTLLESLVLDPIHPAAIQYLRPVASFGASPASTRVWRRIKNLSITMDSFEYGRDLPSDHLKILHTYLQNFVSLERLEFGWLGEKGPCPLSLDAEPCTSRPTSLDCSNACPRSAALPSCKPIKFRHLRFMHLSNATLDSTQAASFIILHRKVLHEFNFNGCHLRSGTWDDALAPLSRIAGNEDWKRPKEEVMDVPLMLSPMEEKPRTDFVLSNLWDDAQKTHKGLQTLKKMSLRTRELLPLHVRRLLRNARVGWH